MTTTIGNSFLERTFGRDAVKIEEAFVAAGHAAHHWSQDAQVSSGRPSHHPYGGTYWLALPDEVVKNVGPLLRDAEVAPVPGVPYSILVVNGVAILPVKVIEDGTRNGRMRVRLSQLRARLARLNDDFDPNQISIFDANHGHPDAAGEDLAAILADLAKEREAIETLGSRLVVAAYQCSPASGLRAVEVGVARFDDKGFIDFFDSQELALLGDPLPLPKPTLVAGSSFDAAPRRKAVLRPVDEPTVADDLPEGE